jgi:5-guanidino-2-oxopentanoate decarboxylase
MSQSCGVALVRLLEKYDVDTVFGIPGVHTLSLYKGLEGSTIRHISPRNEQGAGFMADGYARATGKPGVTFLITGPGVTNAATPMGQAFSDSVPMLVISSTNSRASLGRGEGRLHEITDQRAVTAPLTAFSETVMEPEQIPELLARAFNIFASKRPRPVHIEIPIDVLDLMVEEEWHPVQPQEIASPHPELVQQAADKILGSKHPILIVGGGVRHAREELLALVEKANIPLVTTISGKGAIPESHPLSLGTNLTQPEVQELIRDADVVLAIGTEMAETDMWVDELTINGEIIRVDIDPGELNGNYPATIAIQADGKKTVSALSDALGNGRSDNAEAKTLVAKTLETRADSHAELQQKHGRILETLRSVVEEDAMVVSDMTQIAYSGSYLLPTELPDTWIHPNGYGTLGFAVPAAIGAKVGLPDRQVIALVGDSGILYTIQEMACAAEINLPFTIILWDNDSLGEIYDGMVGRGQEAIGVSPRNPDYLMLARGFGFETSQANNRNELAQQLSAALAHNGPSFIRLHQKNEYQ